MSVRVRLTFEYRDHGWHEREIDHHNANNTAVSEKLPRLTVPSPKRQK